MRVLLLLLLQLLLPRCATPTSGGKITLPSSSCKPKWCSTKSAKLTVLKSLYSVRVRVWKSFWSASQKFGSNLKHASSSWSLPCDHHDQRILLRKRSGALHSSRSHQSLEVAGKCGTRATVWREQDRAYCVCVAYQSIEYSAQRSVEVGWMSHIGSAACAFIQRQSTFVCLFVCLLTSDDGLVGTIPSDATHAWEFGKLQEWKQLESQILIWMDRVLFSPTVAHIGRACEYQK